MTVTDVRERCAKLCDAAAARWRKWPRDSDGRSAAVDHANEAAALAAEVRALPPDDATERAARGQAWALAEAQGEAAMLRARLVAAENDRDFWRMQLECAGPLIDAMRSLQRRFCPMMPGSVCRAGEVVAAIGAQVDALTARAVDAEAEAARRTDELVAIGAALGRGGATAGECHPGPPRATPSEIRATTRATRATAQETRDDDV